MRGRRAGPRQVVARWRRALDPGHQQAAAGARWRHRAADQGATVARPKRVLRSRSARAQPVEGQRFRHVARSVGGVGRSRSPRPRQAQRRAAQSATAGSGGRVSPPIAPPAPALRGLRAVAAEQDPRCGEAARPLRAAWESGGRAQVGLSPVGSSAQRFCVASAQPGCAAREPGAVATQRAAAAAATDRGAARPASAGQSRLPRASGRSSRTHGQGADGRTRCRHFGRAAHMAGGDARRGRAGVLPGRERFHRLAQRRFCAKRRGIGWMGL